MISSMHYHATSKTAITEIAKCWSDGFKVKDLHGNLTCQPLECHQSSTFWIFRIFRLFIKERSPVKISRWPKKSNTKATWSSTMIKLVHFKERRIMTKTMVLKGWTFENKCGPKLPSLITTNQPMRKSKKIVHQGRFQSQLWGNCLDALNRALY